MAKVAFSKFKCSVDTSVKNIPIGAETVEVKQYLPIQEKLALVGRVLVQAHEEDNNFSNPLKASVFRDLEIIFAYTNITFTDKQKEDLPKLYDLMASSGILSNVFEAIPASELEILDNAIWDTTEAYYAYQSSVLGILDAVRSEQKDMEVDVEKLQTTIQELAKTPLVQEIMPLLGLE